MSHRSNIVINCQNCKKDFFSWYNKKSKFCSKKCYSVAQKSYPTNNPCTKIIKECRVCYQQFKVVLARQKTAHFCSLKCKYMGRKILFICIVCGVQGHTNPSRMRKGNGKFCSKKCFQAWCIGPNNPAWKGGVTSIKQRITTSIQYLEWRRKIYERDDYTCQNCGDKKGGNLEADHIVPFAYIVQKYKINTFNKALRCTLLWDIKNGRTLCIECHKKTPTWGSKTKKLLRLYKYNEESLLQQFYMPIAPQ